MNEEIENLLHREGLSLASVQKRAVAFFIDEMLLSFLLIAALWSSFEQVSTAEELILFTNHYIFEYILMKILYQTFFVMQYGATLGKLAMKIRVVSIKTLDNPSFVESLNRAVFRIISEMLFYLGFVWGIMDPLRRTWHDLSARTLVVNA